MSGLDSIPVVVEGEAETDLRTQNLNPLLLQLEQALQDLVETGSSTVIDLTAMPFTSQDEDDLRRQLGKGEVSAILEAFGPTLLQETALPGVWLVEHKDAEGHRLTLQLEVSRIPGILVTPDADLADGLEVLKAANNPQARAADDQDPGDDPG